MATGVLVVGVEKATRLLGHLTLTEKEYVATIRLGQSTDTDDAEGDGDRGGARRAGCPLAQVRTAAAAFTGEIQQVPPAISAIKVDGQRAYQLTRAGAAPELAARPVTVYEFTVTDRAPRPATCSTSTSPCAAPAAPTSGRWPATSGRALGTGGHLTRLRRTRVGPYRHRAPPAPWSSSPSGSRCCRWPRRPRRPSRAGP